MQGDDHERVMTTEADDDASLILPSVKRES